GRLTQILRGAGRDAGVGLYYPIAMFQADLTASEKFWPKICDQHKDRQHDWDRTEKALLNGDVEYMIVHSEAVAEAEIENGRMNIGYGSYHTLVIPQLDFIPLSVVKQLNQFEKSGGKVFWVDQLPRGAEYEKNNAEVNKALANARIVSVEALAGQIGNSYSPEFDLTFTPGTQQLAVGRFRKNGEQVYLLVNRLQEAIEVEIEGHRENNASGKVRLLNPSTGEISELSLPVRLSVEANRSVLLMPNREYLSHKLKEKQ
uniref:hypothetical protein n=1 Tax=Mariniphaga sediminis TaxID=1628158 RepID=UPI003566243C